VASTPCWRREDTLTATDPSRLFRPGAIRSDWIDAMLGRRRGWRGPFVRDTGPSGRVARVSIAPRAVDAESSRRTSSEARRECRQPDKSSAARPSHDECRDEEDNKRVVSAKGSDVRAAGDLAGGRRPMARREGSASTNRARHHSERREVVGPKGKRAGLTASARATAVLPQLSGGGRSVLGAPD
jgi:hypothetical protein